MLVKENIFNKEADEANLRLNDVLDNESKGSFFSKSEDIRPIEEVNQMIQEAFNNETNGGNDVPTYVTNETAAIKITGDKK